MVGSRDQTLGGGGFVPSILPSPPPSLPSEDDFLAISLPTMRQRPLRPATPKYDGFIVLVENKLAEISRRFEKRSEMMAGLAGSTSQSPSSGYRNIGEMTEDLNLTLDLVWISATPSLQTAFLLNIALTMCSALSVFPFDPRPIFRLLGKLDLVLCSMLRGSNLQSGMRLPGFEGDRGRLSTTEKVRIRGIVERTRVAVVEAASKGGGEYSINESVSKVESDDQDTQQDSDSSATQERDLQQGYDRWEMLIARVYERTLEELGESLSSLNSNQMSGLKT